MHKRTSFNFKQPFPSLHNSILWTRRKCCVHKSRLLSYDKHYVVVCLNKWLADSTSQWFTLFEFSCCKTTKLSDKRLKGFSCESWHGCHLNYNNRPLMTGFNSIMRKLTVTQSLFLFQPKHCYFKIWSHEIFSDGTVWST